MGTLKFITFTLFALIALDGCQGCRDDSKIAPSTKTIEQPAQKQPLQVSMFDILPHCSVFHRGAFIDFGKEGEVLPTSWNEDLSSQELKRTEHEGTDWMRVYKKRISIPFVWHQASPVFVAMRAKGGSSSRVSLALDDQPLATLRFERDQIRIANTPPSTAPLEKGLHSLSIQYSGHSQEPDAFGEIDWIRIAAPDNIESTYFAPTSRDLIQNAATLSGVPRKAIALRSPSTLRCPVHVPPKTELHFAMGVTGASTVTLSVRSGGDLTFSKTLFERTIVGGNSSTWSDVRIPLEEFAYQPIFLQFDALGEDASTRLLLGDPTLQLQPPITEFPSARLAVVIAMSGLIPEKLPGYSNSPSEQLSFLNEFSRTSTLYLHHSTFSTSVSSSMASLMTGAHPQSHGLVDANATLATDVQTLGKHATENGIETVFLTGVPRTFRAFGFSNGWKLFSEFAPMSGELATTPIANAQKWISETFREKPDTKGIVFIHTRGAHPPWDVIPKEFPALKPPEYSGVIEPRRSAQMIGKLRTKKSLSTLSSADWERMRSLETVALTKQDESIRQLVDELKQTHLWDETLFIITGDVSSGLQEKQMYADELSLQNSVLHLPLYIHFPKDALANMRIQAPTDTTQIAQTIHACIGSSKDAHQDDLFSIARGIHSSWLKPHIAIHPSQYLTQWGPFQISSTWGKPPILCDTTTDPGCAFDKKLLFPEMTLSLFRIMRHHMMTMTTHDRIPATIDPETYSALAVWGDVPPLE